MLKYFSHRNNGPASREFESKVNLSHPSLRYKVISKSYGKTRNGGEGIRRLLSIYI